jgi:hypothetical protein
MSDAYSWIIFGPDLEPLESEARRLAEAPGPRADGLIVAGDIEEVGTALVDAADGWVRLEHVRPDGTREPVHVQASHVRFILPATPAALQSDARFSVPGDEVGRHRLKGLQ